MGLVSSRPQLALGHRLWKDIITPCALVDYERSTGRRLLDRSPGRGWHVQDKTSVSRLDADPRNGHWRRETSPESKQKTMIISVDGTRGRRQPSHVVKQGYHIAEIAEVRLRLEAISEHGQARHVQDKKP